MFKVNHINKDFGKTRVLDDINITIPQDKLTCIIGPNGAGKSTLLSIISRLNTANGGSVLLEDKDIKDWDTTSLAQTLSIMKQLNNINVRLTINDLVSFGRYPYSKDKLNGTDKEIIHNALEYTGLTDIAHRFLDELSGGQKQRAYIAMVLAQDTKYILLDEPLNNLDIKHILEVMHLLKKLVDEMDKTIVIVVHDINIASTFADYIIAMKKGRVIQEGIVDEIINEDILYKIYDIDFHIEDFKSKKICLYY